VRISKRGAPQRLNKPHVTSLNQLSGILGNKLFSKEHHNFVTSQKFRFANITSSICAGHDYAAMLRGEAQFAVFGKCMPWDHLPGLAMLLTLGFVYCKQDGSAYVPGDTTGGIIIAPNQQMLDDIRAIVMGK
jgi:fructose-1,6-bisphosphatase/inositol monophosphatase family enzyme